MTVNEGNAELVILGAGPGDPELITLKGFNILQKANVVLYDNLANQELLNYTKPDCEHVYVGKKPYTKYTSQEEIHELIEHYSKKGGMIVRLKGGDPFIFGRGYEEVVFARQLGIKTTYVPGITSMQASGLNDIPLTHRAVSESVWMLTGTKKDGTLSGDLQLAMQSNATVAIYMGMKQLPEIARIYTQYNKGDTPAAIIQHASLPHQRSVKGAIKDMPALAEQHQLTYPSIIIIGKVTSLDDNV
ncbi:uroporphyrinogen-III C-methyltransferase [Mucilaginibacter limnophilus]|uniref:uroporphyrinogen-III C-methyltransferase n=1 Tax=Mucilaginibacter limnophilus TaxID=1932778 RepID=A0A437MRW0_9SPHI|nr:uroporphyrinogen-III C-methyltransferase [Mucilaginibacter limnophilus]RVU00364.1 uroporphyrinogen-III C-methyltransferase [Mucilaginibacter limnophilus]